MLDITELVRSEVARQMEQLIVRTTIADVDLDAKRIKVKVGEGESGWVEFSGSKSSWAAPKKGAPIIMLNPCGDIDQGVALDGGYSDEHPSPSSDDNAWVEERGSSRVTIKDGEIIVKANKVTVDASVAIIKGRVLLGGEFAMRPVEGSPTVFVV